MSPSNELGEIVKGCPAAYIAAYMYSGASLRTRLGVTLYSSLQVCRTCTGRSETWHRSLAKTDRRGIHETSKPLAGPSANSRPATLEPCCAVHQTIDAAAPMESRETKRYVACYSSSSAPAPVVEDHFETWLMSCASVQDGYLEYLGSSALQPSAGHEKQEAPTSDAEACCPSI